MDENRDRQPGHNRAPPSPVTIQLPPTSEAASIARKFVEDYRDHLDPEMIEDAKLLVSEIVTNAVLYGRPEITLILQVDPPALGIAVMDAGDGQPVFPDQTPQADATSGRGLLIVDTVASAWGVRPNSPAPGKTVWFDLIPA